VIGLSLRESGDSITTIVPLDGSSEDDGTEDKLRNSICGG
jgi:hypothetical protein